MIRPQGAGEAAVLANLTDEESANYILHILKAGAGGAPKLDRAIWFDRLDLRISRQILFDDNGDILTDARYRDWQTYDNVPFPKQVEMIRPKDEYGVVMTVVKMEINRGVPEERFALERPAGTQLQVLGKPASKPAASLEDTRGEK
ncbi:MAG: DUF4292 domain-containing protein [Acidobacteria bacterium]|nr:DUF4292 domain-containing protein [Acidobacteriota bacterium]